MLVCTIFLCPALKQIPWPRVKTSAFKPVIMSSAGLLPSQFHNSTMIARVRFVIFAHQNRFLLHVLRRCDCFALHSEGMACLLFYYRLFFASLFGCYVPDFVVAYYCLCVAGEIFPFSLNGAVLYEYIMFH